MSTCLYCGTDEVYLGDGATNTAMATGNVLGMLYLTVDIVSFIFLYGLPKWYSGKETACQCRKHKRHGFDP